MTVTQLLAHRLDRAVAPVSVQGTLALDLQPVLDPPDPEPELPVLGDERDRLERWVRRYAQAAVEIVGGDRPASQLLRWTTAAVHEDLTRRAALVGQAGRHVPGQRRVQPVRPHVESVHVFFVEPRVAEASARVRYDKRSRAVALRFERRRRDWVCTAMEFA